ncbi:transcription factor IIA subunit alpha [Malassezia vespertilionis]|uniref:transcription factor IIA subunit alpha n=1 Tax=Malassezia vespertilionis TaxID=2020962 RepID=UPI0024B06BE9|nr:transcription factor IIA subunit alpha [Malassezia vespertilionis]WFD07278.1 transcription factor IIA subunit alpha [Malassezia vespertilionis]
MSNKVVSSTFRHIIDDVIANVRQDFEDMGIEKEVLEELQRSWEAKLIATQVTEFEGAPGMRPQLTYTPGTAPNVSVTVPRDILIKKENKDEKEGGAAPKSESSEGAAASSSKRKRDAKDEGGDSDEIGSDLDDSEEEEGDGNEDMMLCLYDKVQRVKNKWKCVLRDGVASIHGRDYLFSKCNGEFEW